MRNIQITNLLVMKPVLRRSKSLKYSVNLTFLALTTCRILSSISLRDVELVKLYRQQRNSMTYVWYPSIISIQTCKGQFSNMKLLNDNMTLWLSYITLWTVSLDSAQITLNITESTVDLPSQTLVSLFGLACSTIFYYMASSASGQDEPNLVLRLAT